VAPQLDESATSGREYAAVQVVEASHRCSGVPDGHLTGLLPVARDDGVPELPQVLERLQEMHRSGPVELRFRWMHRMAAQSSKEAPGVVEGAEGAPASEDVVQTRTGTVDFGPCLVRRELQDRDEGPLEHAVRDAPPMPSDDDEEVDVRVLPVLAASHGAVDACGDEVRTLPLPELRDKRLRDREPAAPAHGKTNARGPHEGSPAAGFIGGERLPSSMMRLATIALVVKDGKTSAKWYQEKLGFEVRDHQGHWITVAPKKENIAFHLCEGFYDLEPGNSGISFTTKDVKKEEQAMRKAGVEFAQGTTKEDWGTYAVFKDPDGNEFWLMEE